jgi:hypothetical protein
MAREKSWTQNINRFLTLFSIQPSMHSTTMIITFLRFFNMCSSSPFVPLVINFETIATPFIIKYIGGRVYHPTPTEKKNE